MMSENGSPRHSPHRNKWEPNYTYIDIDLTVNNNVFVACKETRREADSKISGQRHQDRNIHRKDLQQNVNISTNDNSTAGGGSPQGTQKVYGLNPSNFWHFKTVENWNFELFSFAKSTSGSPLKYMGQFIVIRKSLGSTYFLLLGYHLLMNDYGYCNKFKIPPSTLETLLGHLELGYAR